MDKYKLVRKIGVQSHISVNDEMKSLLDPKNIFFVKIFHISYTVHNSVQWSNQGTDVLREK